MIVPCVCEVSVVGKEDELKFTKESKGAKTALNECIVHCSMAQIGIVVLPGHNSGLPTMAFSFPVQEEPWKSREFPYFSFNMRYLFFVFEDDIPNNSTILL